MQNNPSSSCGSGEESQSSRCARLVQMVLSSSGQERDEAAKLLLEQCIQPLVQRVARRRCRFSQQHYNDFCDQAPAHVFEKLSYFDPQKGYSFLAWCSRVLRNLAIDMGKQRERRREILYPMGVVEGKEGLESSNEPPSDESPIVDQVSWGEPISAKGLALVKDNFPPLQRVIWVAMAGLVYRVDAAVWKQWLEEADVEPPFPPKEVYDFDDLLARIDCISQALGMSRDGVRQHWYRARNVLRKKLEILQSLEIL